MKRNVHVLFDELCTEVFYGLNMKMVMMDWTEDQCSEMEDFIRHCREGRKAGMLPHYHFADRPNTKISWSEWNSGGGCMIWSHEFCDGTSLHVTDELLVLSKYNTEKHFDAEFERGGADEDDVDYILLTHYFEDPEHPTSDQPLSFYLCPFLGQEMADLVAHDVSEILRCW